ncbi:MAG: metal-dependent transcriptional regulator, partial [Pseudonocardiaceae bacterium]
MKAVRASTSVEDYVKAIFKLTDRQGLCATTSSLAETIGVSPASASGMLRRLRELRLVKHERYGDIELTTAGRELALNVLRRHR